MVMLRLALQLLSHALAVSAACHFIAALVLKQDRSSADLGPKVPSNGSNSPLTPAITPASLSPAPGPTTSWPPRSAVTAPVASTWGVSGAAVKMGLPLKCAPLLTPKLPEN